jgi:hypothetical protein
MHRARRAAEENTIFGSGSAGDYPDMKIQGKKEKNLYSTNKRISNFHSMRILCAYVLCIHMTGAVKTIQYLAILKYGLRALLDRSCIDLSQWFHVECVN